MFNHITVSSQITKVIKKNKIAGKYSLKKEKILLMRYFVLNLIALDILILAFYFDFF